MSDVNTDTQASKTFNAEAFAMNIAKAMETSGQALAAYLKPREGGEPKDKPPSEIGEVIKTFTKVAEYWLSDQDARRGSADQDGQGLSRSLGLRRRAAWPANRRRLRSSRRRATSASRTRSGSRTSSSTS